MIFTRSVGSCVAIIGVSIFSICAGIACYQRQRGLDALLNCLSIIGIVGLCQVGLILCCFEVGIEQSRPRLIRWFGPIIVWILMHKPTSYTEIMKEPIYYARYEVVDAMIEIGIHKVDRDGFGCTPLHHACILDERRIAQRLVVTYPPLLQQITTRGQTALNVAISSHHYELVIDLIRMGAWKNPTWTRDYPEWDKPFQELFQAIGWVKCRLKPKKVHRIRQEVYFESSLMSLLLMYIC